MARMIRRASSCSLALAATLVASSCTTVHDVGETQNPVTTCSADESCRLDEVCDPTRKVCLRPPPADQLDDVEQSVCAAHGQPPYRAARGVPTAWNLKVMVRGPSTPAGPSLNGVHKRRA